MSWLYNVLCLVSFLLSILSCLLLKKPSKPLVILRVISFILFAYKTVYYIVENLKGNIYIPVEISTISYFLMFVILIFKIKSLYGVGAFFGIMAGIGYFAFYIFLGFTVANSLAIKDILIGCFSHGFLFIAGLFLFKHYQIEKSDTAKIWISIFAMLCWALVFYDIEMPGITFIYYIIKPEFLLVFPNMSFNVLLLMIYYVVLVVVFWGVVKLFYKINNDFFLKKGIAS